LEFCTTDQVYYNRAELAINIEEAMYKLYQDTGRDYKQKYRTLFSNISDKKNQELRNNLYSGSLTPDQIINMTHEELASPELQEQRRKIRDRNTEARMDERKVATCTAWTCRKCGHNLTSYYTLQIRSADEPMTVFITCQNCKNQWKIN